MRKTILFLIAVLLTFGVTAETTTFAEGQTQTMNIGGQEVDMELYYVNEDPDNPGKYQATFNLDGSTMTVTSWNYFNYTSENGYRYAHDSMNGEPIALMDWSGAETDEVTDDSATLAWGREYFPCEDYVANGVTEYKFCGDGTQKRVEIDGEYYTLEYSGANLDEGSPDMIKANFLTPNGGTNTFLTPNAIRRDDQNLASLGGATVVLKQVRGLHTDRSEDDAALIQVMPPKEVELEESFTVRQGERIEFGDDDGNYFRLEDIRQDAAWIIPSPSVDTGAGTDRLGILSTMEIDFPGGSFLVHVQGMDANKEEATMMIERANPLNSVDFQEQSRDGLQIELSANVEADGGVDLIEWDLDGDGNYEKQGRDITHTYDSGGDKEVTMRASAGEFSETASKTFTFESQDCSYDLLGQVEGYTYQQGGVTGNIEVQDGSTQIAADGSFGFTKVLECGSTATVEYTESGNVIASTQVDLPEQGGEVDGIQIDAADSRTEDDYRMEDYSRGTTVTLAPGEGIRFGDDSRLYLESIWRYDQDTLMTDAWADQVIQDYSSVEDINRYKFAVPSRQYSSTVQQFNDGEHAVGTCELNRNNVEFVVETLDETDSEWPDAWCSGERTGDDPDDYETVEAERVTDYLGANIPEVGNMTEIQFGDDLQNSLFVKEVYEPYRRNTKVVASPQSPENDEVELNWSQHVVPGKEMHFDSLNYTVHICHRGESGDQLTHLGIAKQDGTDGYDACFEDENHTDRSDWNQVNYVQGTTARVDEGDVLVFGEDRYYVDRLYYAENIERYDMRGYSARPTSNQQAGMPEGSRTETYFKTGRKQIYFCNYNETIEKAKIAINGQLDMENEEACASETSPEPEGTVSLGNSNYLTGANATVTYSIAQRGAYELQIEVDGSTVSSATLSQTNQGELETTLENSGTLTAELVAPGDWWNPLDSDRVVDSAEATVEDSDEVSAPGTEFTDVTDTINATDTIEVEGTVNDTRAPEGYTVKLETQGETRSSSGQRPQFSFTFEPPEDGWTTGGAEVAIRPSQSWVDRFNPFDNVQDIATRQIGIGSGTTGGDDGDDDDGEDSEEASGWRDYCSQQGYDDSVESLTACIDAEITPLCFEGEAGENCGTIGSDICSELYNNAYSSRRTMCLPPEAMNPGRTGPTPR
jgi:hypothetical protein